MANIIWLTSKYLENREFVVFEAKELELQELDKEINPLIFSNAFDLFRCNKIATKAIPEALDRLTSLKKLGFKYSNEKLVGHDGTLYGSY